jgi:hypothetical protein
MEAMGTNSTFGAGAGPGVPLESHSANPSADERTYTMWMHLGGMLTSLFLNAGLALPFPLVLVLVLWLVKRDQSKFIDDHGKEALNFQITHVIYSIAIFLLGFPTFTLAWWVGWPFLFILTLVAGIMASRAANEGRYYRYPMCFRFVK